jgi:hypothetical protein
MSLGSGSAVARPAPLRPNPLNAQPIRVTTAQRRHELIAHSGGHMGRPFMISAGAVASWHPAATHIYVVATYVDGTYATLASANTAVSATIRSRVGIGRLAGAPRTRAEAFSANFAG